MPPRLGPLLALPLTAGAVYFFPFPRRSDTQSLHPSLDPHRFTPWTVVSKLPVGDSAALLTVRPPTPPADEQELYKTGTWSVEAKNERLSVGRGYTPFPPLDASRDGDLNLFIRGAGETSRLLASRGVGETLPLRGPGKELVLPVNEDGQPARIAKVVFVAGGTGVAPALQLARTVLEQKAGKSRMALLWASRATDLQGGTTSEDLAPAARWWSWGTQTYEAGEANAVVRYVQGLQERFRSRGNTMDVAYLPDWRVLTMKYLASVVGGTQEEEAQEDGLKLLVVSGPEGFVSHFAGPKIYADGREQQGPVGGVLGELKRQGRLQGWMVWKL